MPIAPEENTWVQAAPAQGKPLCQDTQSALESLRGLVRQKYSGEMFENNAVSQQSQSAADSNFTDAVARREIPGLQLQAWRDPKTGLTPSFDILKAAMEHDANPFGPDASDQGTLANLANDLSNRRMSDRGPINLAYLHNLITNRDFRDLTDLYDSYRDPEKFRWFDYAKAAFDARFPDIADPNGKSADTTALFPAFLTNLDHAVRDEDLKGAQIGQVANKMLQDLDKVYVGQYFGRLGAAQASQIIPRNPASTSEPPSAGSSVSAEDRGSIPSCLPEQEMGADRRPGLIRL
jgi:hypothetical protein